MPQKVFLFVISFTIFTGLASADSKNLIKNPSFENGESEPESWLKVPLKELSSKIWSKHAPKDGKKCIEIKAFADKRGAFFRMENPIPVSAGKKYIISGWIKSEGAYGNMIKVAWFSKKRWLTNSLAPQVNGFVRQWRFVAKEVTAPKDAICARICVGRQSPSAKGTAWFDNISFIEVGNSTENKKKEIPIEKTKKSIKTTTAIFPQLEWLSSSANVDVDSIYFPGKASERMLIIKNKCPGMQGWVSRRFLQVSPGKRYNFSACVKTWTTYGNTILAINWFDSRKKNIGKAYSPVTNGDMPWNIVNVAGIAPVKAAYARLAFVRMYESTQSSKIVSLFSGMAKPVFRELKNDFNLKENLLKNDSNWMPLGIEFAKKIFINANDAWSGKSSLAVKESYNKNVGWISSEFLVKANIFYKISAMICLRRAYNVKLAVRWYNKDGRLIKQNKGESINGIKAWEKYSFISKSPAEAVRAKILCLQEESNGISGFDDISILPLSKVIQ